MCLLLSKNINNIILNVKNKGKIENNNYYSRMRIEEIKENKYFLMFDNLDEIYEELVNLLTNNKPIIVEESNKLILSIPISTTKIKEIKFEINEKEKSDKEKIQELYLIINNLKTYYDSIIQQQNNKINQLEDKIAKIE